MAGEVVRTELASLRDDIERVRGTEEVDDEELARWVSVLDDALLRLGGRPCPECGGQMEYSATLQAHVCHHYESG
jgi:hypothetical protein